MTQTPKDIEAEVEANRANVEGTLDALRRKASLEGVVSDVGRYVGIADTRATLESTGRQMAANPVAFGLIGLGLACLATGMTRRDTTPTYAQRPYDSMGDRYVADHDSHSSGPGVGAQARAYAGQASDTAKRYGAAASDTAHSYTEAASDAAHRYTEAASDAAHRYSEAAAGAAHDARVAVQEGWEATRNRAVDLTHQMQTQPLLFGALALFAGAVIGSTLPKSNAENRLLGPAHDRLAEGARDLASDLTDRGTAAVKAGLSAASDAAKDEGLIPEGDATLAEKVQHVASAAAEGASSEFRSTEKRD